MTESGTLPMAHIRLLEYALAASACHRGGVGFGQDASANNIEFFIYRDGAGILATNANTSRGYKGSADATSFAVTARKSRGTVAAPTVITTGDDLLTVSGFGYLGATNLYQEATRITHDSTGTIADTTSGIGGIIRFSTAVQGTVGGVERMTLDNNVAAGNTGLLLSIAGGAPIRVSVGAADSGGTGFRTLIVPN